MEEDIIIEESESESISAQEEKDVIYPDYEPNDKSDRLVQSK